MLGLRHFHGYAIDLWQGDVGRFATDILAQFQGQDTVVLSAEGIGSPCSLVQELDAQSPELAYHALLASALVQAGRHLTIALNFAEVDEYFLAGQAKAAFSAVKMVLGQTSVDRVALRRITMAAPNGQVYSAFQQEFFAAFPESL